MSEILTTTFYSSYLKLDWNYDLYLPDGFSTNKKYNLILMFHGLYGNHTNFLDRNRIDSQPILDQLIEKINKPVLVAFVDGFNSFYIDSLIGMKMESAIIDELIPYLRGQYNLSQISIGGISMGGYGASRLALKYPEQFRDAMLISPAVWQINDVPDVIYKSIHAFQDNEKNWNNGVYRKLFPTSYLSQENRKVNFFIESSQLDEIVPINSVNRFINQLKKNNNNLVVTEDEYGGHNWNYWQKAIKQGYGWLINNLPA